MKNDIRYFLSGSFEQDPFYTRYKAMIEKQGSIQVKDSDNIVRIYNPYLFFTLTTKELPVLDVATKKETTINGIDYLKTFILGFNEGMEYFTREFAVSPDTIYGSSYIDDIHYNYFHAKHHEGLNGWQGIKGSHPLVFNHQSIKKFGYYSGIVTKVEELIEKYPKRFENFFNHTEAPVKKLPETKFEIKGINISKLTKELQRLKFFDESYSDSVLNWFKGVPPETPIPMNCNANIFISIIADLIDQGFIKNTKESCYLFISHSFVFKGQGVKPSYIKKVMRPNNENRVSWNTKTIPEVQKFKT